MKHRVVFPEYGLDEGCGHLGVQHPTESKHPDSQGFRSQKYQRNGEICRRRTDAGDLYKVQPGTGWHKSLPDQ